MNNKTGTFGEWWCKKLNSGTIKNDNYLRETAKEAWNESIDLREIYIVFELFPEIKPVKGIFNKIKSLFKRRRILSYWYNPIKGIFTSYRLAKIFIKHQDKKLEWCIIKEVIKK